MGTKARLMSLFAAAAFAASAGCAGQVGGSPGSAGSSGTAGVSGAGTTGSAGASGPGTAGTVGSAGTVGTGVAGTLGSAGTTGAGGTTTACTSLPPVTRRLWRLSVEQYGAAVKDLLNGMVAAPVLTNRGGEAQWAFFSDVTLQVDPDFQFALYQASQAVITALTATQITSLTNCGTQTPMACAMTFAQSFGQKAFRRPLSTTEVTNLMKVYTQGAMQDFNTAIGLMIQALIISPSFVYRTELGPDTLTANASGAFPDTTLTPYEIASQLGFMFLGSLPDAPLLAAATDGSLSTTAGLTTQLNRLLSLQQAKTNITGIMIDWFNVRQMFDKTKDTSLLSTLSTADQDQTGIQNDLLTSTQQFVTNVLWNGSGKIDDLLLSQNVFVNQKLATLFPGLTYAAGTAAPTSNTTFVKASWPTTQGRSGMLTLPSFLWSASDPSLNSIVKRGKLIHDDVICQDPLPPAINLTTDAAVNVIGCKSPDGTMQLSTCDSEILKSDARLMYQPCQGCHSQMDPYARVLQNFGPIGNYRTVDEAGRPIDPSVTFLPKSPLAPQSATGVQAFVQELLASNVFDGCSVQKVASYAIGAMIRTYNTCELNDLRAQTDGTVTSLFRQVALANFVRARAGGMK